jgi:hypothetical protein
MDCEFLMIFEVFQFVIILLDVGIRLSTISLVHNDDFRVLHAINTDGTYEENMIIYSRSSV